MPFSLRARIGVAVLPIALLTISTAGRAQTVWSGLTKTVTRAGAVDGTLPANQDALTPNVIFTRLSSGGLVNFASELSFIGGVSPAGTEWATALNNPSATIAAANWSSLSFTDWIDAFGGEFTSGGGIPNQPAVVHLMTDNIYLDLEFTDWTPGHNAGYAYMRAEPAVVATPTGDYNGDGVVDAADYVVWRDTLGQTVSPVGTGADGNANGTIDGGDFTFWRAHFGNTVLGSGASLATTDVPEPSAVILFFAMSATFYSVREQRTTEST